MKVTVHPGALNMIFSPEQLGFLRLCCRQTRAKDRRSAERFGSELDTASSLAARIRIGEEVHEILGPPPEHVLPEGYSLRHPCEADTCWQVLLGQDRIGRANTSRRAAAYAWEHDEATEARRLEEAEEMMDLRHEEELANRGVPQ